MDETCMHLKTNYDFYDFVTMSRSFCSLGRDSCEDCPYYYPIIDFEGDMADRAYEDYLYGGN